MKNKVQNKALTAEILFMVATAPIILASLFAPNAAQMLKPLLKWHLDWDKIEYKRIREAISRLNKKRLIELKQKRDDLYIEITTNGKKLIKNFDYDNLILPQSKKWDGKWRMVIFDIPEKKKKKERRAFSQKLKDLGFYPLQESVFVYPYDCRDELDFICEFLSISSYVNYCILETIDKEEGNLRNFFDLV